MAWWLGISILLVSLGSLRRDLFLLRDKGWILVDLPIDRFILGKEYDIEIVWTF